MKKKNQDRWPSSGHYYIKPDTLLQSALWGSCWIYVGWFSMTRKGKRRADGKPWWMEDWIPIEKLLSDTPT